MWTSARAASSDGPCAGSGLNIPFPLARSFLTHVGGIDASCDGYYTLRGEQNMRAMGWLGGERAHGGVEALDEREPAVAARGVGFGVERRSSGGEF